MKIFKHFINKSNNSYKKSFETMIDNKPYTKSEGKIKKEKELLNSE